ncbi:hypothetical protein [Streptomyces sp. NPDC002343]
MTRGTALIASTTARAVDRFAFRAAKPVVGLFLPAAYRRRILA